MAEVTPIGRVSGPVKEAVDDVWGGVVSRINLDPSRFPSDCLDGLDGFSHVEVVFAFDRVDESRVTTGARHPRGREDWPRVGIFARPAKNRPNRIGVTGWRLVTVKGLSIEVEGLHAIEGTPVLDIKPWMKGFGPRSEVRPPEWACELMSGYWKT